LLEESSLNRKDSSFFMVEPKLRNSIKTLLKAKISLLKTGLQKIICIFVTRFIGYYIEYKR
ncbi:MAG: hypothetical protein ACTTKN_07845, partial [Phocaeicola sp.]|uniref:hypothetical protein n=1 Tax=Phocaeicola sp. TaxID=2773926 RepID=UPI003F9FEECB